MAKNAAYAEGLVARIAQLVEHCGSQRALASAAKVNEGRLTMMLKARSVPTSDFLAAIVSGTKCSAEWLLCGIGEMFEKGESRPVVVAFSHPSNGTQVGDVEAGYGDLVAIRVLRDPAAAGHGRVIHDEDVEGVGVIHRKWCPHPDETDYVRVKGDSMSPTLPDGSMVTIDRTETNPARLVGQVVAIWRADEDDVTIKRLLVDRKRKVYKCVPDNMTVDNLPFDLADRDRVVGKVRSVHAPVN